MPYELEDFAVPWCQALLKSPSWTIAPLSWETDRPALIMMNEFWQETLSHDRGLRAACGLIRSEANNDPNEPDAMMLLSLAEGLGGAPGILHGGVTATILDMVTGFCVNVVDGDSPITTAMLKVDYKLPCQVPSVTIAKAWIKKRERNKVFLVGHLEESDGRVLARADAIYIKLKSYL